MRTKDGRYRAYLLDNTGRIFRAIELAIAADDTAIDAAQKLIDGHDIELWNKDWRIAKFDRRPSNSQAE